MNSMTRSLALVSLLAASASAARMAPIRAFSPAPSAASASAALAPAAALSAASPAPAAAAPVLTPQTPESYFPALAAAVPSTLMAPAIERESLDSAFEDYASRGTADAPAIVATPSASRRLARAASGAAALGAAALIPASAHAIYLGGPPMPPPSISLAGIALFVGSFAALIMQIQAAAARVRAPRAAPSTTENVMTLLLQLLTGALAASLLTLAAVPLPLTAAVALGIGVIMGDSLYALESDSPARPTQLAAGLAAFALATIGAFGAVSLAPASTGLAILSAVLSIVYTLQSIYRLADRSRS